MKGKDLNKRLRELRDKNKAHYELISNGFTSLGNATFPVIGSLETYIKLD